MQLTWNYNYGACGKAIGQPLLATPTLVSTDDAITWQTGLWFWMTNDVGTGKTPHPAIANGNFWGTINAINAINAGLECGGATKAQANASPPTRRSRRRWVSTWAPCSPAGEHANVSKWG